jgi:hypothetical protein
MTVSELYNTFANFSQTGFFREVFSFYQRGAAIRLGISEAAIGRGGGAQRPVFRVNEPKKTGACSAQALMRGQKPLVYKTER